jgi:hypothetical protein
MCRLVDRCASAWSHIFFFLICMLVFIIRLCGSTVVFIKFLPKKKKKKLFTFCFACSHNDWVPYIWYQSGFDPVTMDRYAFHYCKPLSFNLMLIKTLRVHAVISIRGNQKGLRHGFVEGRATPPEVPTPSESKPQGEEEVLGLDSNVLRDSDG